MPTIRLGINVDHVATVRNARGGRHPDPVRAAEIAIAAGADGQRIFAVPQTAQPDRKKAAGILAATSPMPAWAGRAPALNA